MFGRLIHTLTLNRHDPNTTSRPPHLRELCAQRLLLPVVKVDGSPPAVLQGCPYHHVTEAIQVQVLGGRQRRAEPGVLPRGRTLEDAVVAQNALQERDEGDLLQRLCFLQKVSSHHLIL